MAPPTITITRASDHPGNRPNSARALDHRNHEHRNLQANHNDNRDSHEYQIQHYLYTSTTRRPLRTLGLGNCSLRHSTSCTCTLRARVERRKTKLRNSLLRLRELHMRASTPQNGANSRPGSAAGLGSAAERDRRRSSSISRPSGMNGTALRTSFGSAGGPRTSISGIPRAGVSRVSFPLVVSFELSARGNKT